MKRAAGFMLTVLAGSAAHAQVNAPANPSTIVEAVVRAIEACQTRLDPQIDIGYERIAARCPDLARRLEQNALAAWLPEGWKDTGNNLSAGSLRELAVLMKREIATPASRRTPDVKHLHAVLSEIGQSAQQQSSFWKRVRLWLRKVFPSNAEPTDTGWIPRMISRIGLPQTVIELITYTALALVVALSLLILTNELRSAGLFKRRRSRTEPLQDGTATHAPTRVDWPDVERADLSDKPRVLLELLIDRLTTAHRLPPARALTTRELTTLAKLREVEDRQRLQVVAQTAERARYSGTAASRAEVERAIEEGRALLNVLEHAK